MIDVLRNNGVQLRHTFYADGTAITADGNVTYTVTRADGSTLTSGTASLTSTYYWFNLAPQATLNILTVTWTGTFGGVQMSQSDDVEIVGGVYVSIAELRTVAGLSDSTKVSNDTLVATRSEFEDLAERYCGVAFVPRYARDALRGTGRTSVLLDNVRPRTILAASSTDTQGVVTTYTTTNWQLDRSGLLVTDGDILTASTYGERNLVVEYEHGHDNPPPGIVRACKLYCQWQLLRDRSQVGRDIRSISDPSGFNTSYSLPDWDAGRPTGIGEIDQALNAVGRAAPRVA